MSYGWVPPEEPGQQAGRAFLSGFSGCLGVGLAIVFVCLLLLVGCSLMLHVHR